MTPAHLRIRADAEAALKSGGSFGLATDLQQGHSEPEVYAKRPHLAPPVLLGVALPSVSFVLEVPRQDYDPRRLAEWFTQKYPRKET